MNSIAPGKIILTGEHSVVHGKMALIAAINREVGVSIKRGNRDQILVEAGAIGLKKTYSIDDLTDYWKNAQVARNLFIEMGDDSLWKKITTDPEMVVKASLGLFYEELGMCAGTNIVICSDVLVGSGMGSSASVATALLGGLSEYFAFSWTKEQLYERVFQVEQVAHGKASGADPTAVLYGGFIQFIKKNGTPTFQTYTNPKIKGFFQLVDSGKPAETTGEMVSKINYQLSIDNYQTKKTIEKIGSLSQTVIEQVKNGNLNFDWLEENERLLEELGVVSESTKKLIQRLKILDIGAKVCGAGGVKTGSGIVLAYHQDLDQLEYSVAKLNKPHYQITLGVEGWHRA